MGAPDQQWPACMVLLGLLGLLQLLQHSRAQVYPYGNDPRQTPVSQQAWQVLLQ
jgi:hypothetical protein